jgi:hypothetical protein
MQLVHRYAICTRQLSEAVATLGGHRIVARGTHRLWGDIKQLHARCSQLAEEIDRHVTTADRSAETHEKGNDTERRG